METGFDYEGEIPLRGMEGDLAGRVKVQAASGVVWLTASVSSDRGQGFQTVELLQPSEVHELIGALRMALDASHEALHGTGAPA